MDCMHDGKKIPVVHNRPKGPDIQQIVETKCVKCKKTTNLDTRIIKGGNN